MPGHTLATQIVGARTLMDSFLTCSARTDIPHTGLLTTPAKEANEELPVETMLFDIGTLLNSRSNV